MVLSLSDLHYGQREAFVEDSIQTRGTVTAPAANTIINSVVLTPGYWELTAFAKLGTGGAPVAADSDNVKLRDDTGAVDLLVLPLVATQNSAGQPVCIRRKFTAASTTVAIRSVGAGTASVVYQTTIIAKKLMDL